eukprot:1192091-Rhodomonas_salina.4
MPSVTLPSLNARYPLPQCTLFLLNARYPLLNARAMYLEEAAVAPLHGPPQHVIGVGGGV